MLLHVPSDYESLTEFQLLCVELKKRRTHGQVTDATVEAMATFLMLRLYRSLAYLARHNNRPGYLTVEGVELFNNSVDALFGEGSEPLPILVAARFLEKAGEEYFCKLFGRDNRHLAGNFKDGPDKGNKHSIISRQQKNLAKEANAQGMLLGSANPEIFKKRDGSEMNDGEKQRVMLLLRNIDNCLGLPARKTHAFSEGLILDAGDVVTGNDPELLREFYNWLYANRENPYVPKTADEILKDFPGMLARMKAEEIP